MCSTRESPQSQKFEVPIDLSALRGEIIWSIEPSRADLPLCRSVIFALLSKFGVDRDEADEPISYSVEKISKKRVLLRHCDESRQLYFKLFLPRFSWQWKRGPWFFTPPAIRQSVWFTRLKQWRIGVVDLVGVAVLPWKNRFSMIQPPSITITASPLGTQNVRQAIASGDLLSEQCRSIAETILSYVEILHGNRVGYLDVLAANMLYNAEADEVLFCDLDRLTKLRWWNAARRIKRDNRKVRSTLQLIHEGEKTKE